MAGPLNRAAVALSALAAVDFQHTSELRSVWRDRPDDVAELNGSVVRLIIDELLARAPPGAEGNPLGRVVLGQAGAGKTHVLGALRREMWRRGGWFVLLDLLDIGDFWATAALSFVDALGRPMADRRTQGEAVMALLQPRRTLLARLRRRLTGRRVDGLADALALLTQLRKTERGGAQAHRDVILAFAALHGVDPAAQDLARSWLQGGDIGAAGQLALGVLSPTIFPRRAVEGLSWLMAQTGPTLLAIDQIDAIISIAHAQDPGTAEPARRRARAVLDEVAGGLMALRDTLYRSMTLLSTLEATWEVLSTRAVRSFAGRFHAPIRLQSLSSADLARRLVEARLAWSRPASSFVPPYPTWPFRPESFATAIDFTPRQLLQACEAHRSACLLRGEVSELHSFAPGGSLVAADSPAPHPAFEGDLDALFDSLRAACTVAGVLDPENEAAAANLLRAVLTVFRREADVPAARTLILEDEVAGLHARLRLIDHAAAGAEWHVSFRIVPQSSARAVQPRVREAMIASGIEQALPFRHLVIVRDGDWPTGPKSQELVEALTARGGQVLAPSEDEWRSFAALQQMADRAPPGLDKWLRRRRPLAGSAFFRAVGIVAVLETGVPPPPAALPVTAPVSDPVSVVVSTPSLTPLRPTVAMPPDASIPLGTRPGDRAQVQLPVRLLPRHVVVIAGSGSGKTVLLRRVIEESALAGVPAIVLDSNNDLVRLGMAWPPPPPDFSPADREKAARLLESIEMVVWTPGRSRGRPLAFAALPDFAAVRHDPDETEIAVGMALASLRGIVPTGGLVGPLRRGVLTDALRFFAARGGGGLDALIELLRDLPPDVTAIDKAPKLAAEIANALLAARASNPLLDAPGAAADPADLLTSADGRTRISVISLAGLPSDEARQDFVARLLMALFSHIRRHPATEERPVTGLLVMDEAQNFAPSVQSIASRAATLALVRQARKYGLGMVFATQMPRAIDTGIIGNCTTQLFGRLNAPAAMDAVRDVLASRGGAPDDLGRLAPGQFYLTTEGRERPQKLQAPLCLTWHAANPPSEEEVVAIAASRRA